MLAVQESQDGTGHAVRVAWEALDPAERAGTVLVAYGDTPLLEGESLRPSPRTTRLRVGA